MMYLGRASTLWHGLPAHACALAAAALFSAGCAPVIGIADMDRLERSLDARTVVLEEDYTLWSPFSHEDTREWIEQIEEELAVAREIFAARAPERILIVLVPVAGLGRTVTADGGRISVMAGGAHPLHGMAGYAGDDQIVIYVAPDELLGVGERQRRVHHGARDYRSTLRHEMAHVHAHAAGLDGATWFDEGVADLVQEHLLVDGKLVDAGPSVIMLLHVSSTVPPEQWGVGRLLAWHEDGARIAQGEEALDKAARTLCGLFMRFLAERESHPYLVERLRAVARLRDGELLALDAAWRAWLAAALERLPYTADEAASVPQRDGSS